MCFLNWVTYPQLGISISNSYLVKISPVGDFLLKWELFYGKLSGQVLPCLYILEVYLVEGAGMRWGGQGQPELNQKRRSGEKGGRIRGASGQPPSQGAEKLGLLVRAGETQPEGAGGRKEACCLYSHAMGWKLTAVKSVMKN